MYFYVCVCCVALLLSDKLESMLHQLHDSSIWLPFAILVVVAYFASFNNV